MSNKEEIRQLWDEMARSKLRINAIEHRIASLEESPKEIKVNSDMDKELELKNELIRSLAEEVYSKNSKIYELQDELERIRKTDPKFSVGPKTIKLMEYLHEQFSRDFWK